MFELDPWAEVFENIWRRRSRSLLTAFSVVWGLFILILLLGMGESVRLSLEQDFESEATNSITLSPGQVTLPFNGLPVGRRVRLSNRSLAKVASLPQIEHVSGCLVLYPRKMIRKGNKFSRLQVYGVQEGYRFFQKTRLLEGRFIDALDCSERRKVVVIGQEAANLLFQKGEVVEGSLVLVENTPFQVVGVFQDEGPEDEARSIYMPLETGQAFDNVGNYFHNMSLLLKDKDLEKSLAIQSEVINIIAKEQNFDPKDARALNISNNLLRVREFLGVFSSVRTFLWIMGLGTLMAGMVGISNIMLISVRERRVEIGLRKALGATSGQISALFIREALCISLCAGVCGIFLGLLSLKLLDWAIRHLPALSGMRSGTLNSWTIFAALALMVLAAFIAGWLPARHAAKIQAVDALREY